MKTKKRKVLDNGKPFTNHNNIYPVVVLQRTEDMCIKLGTKHTEKKKIKKSDKTFEHETNKSIEDVPKFNSTQREQKETEKIKVMFNIKLQTETEEILKNENRCENLNEIHVEPILEDTQKEENEIKTQEIVHNIKLQRSEDTEKIDENKCAYATQVPVEDLPKLDATYKESERKKIKILHNIKLHQEEEEMKKMDENNCDYVRNIRVEEQPKLVATHTEQKECKTRKNKPEKNHKRHSCLYCQKQVFQIVRHWRTVHAEEKEVQDFQGLQKLNPLRRKIIDNLRKKGDFQFNLGNSTGGEDLIVTRVSKNSEAAYIPCPSCYGFYSKKNLRKHWKTCSPKKYGRHLQGDSRKLMKYVHEKASDTLRNSILSDMYPDEITKQLLFDEILIVYGNYLCIKYTENHLKNHIRAQLRLLGRFMVSVKKINEEIEECRDLIHSKHIDTIRLAIDDISGIDLSSNTYKHPTNARTMITELRKIIQVVKSESDKSEDDLLMKRVKGLSRRVKQELAPYINRICKNSENKIKRAKQRQINDLPENSDIGSYLEKVYKEIYIYQKDLERKFSLQSWNNLSKYIMVYLAAFNRKRPGETQRMELEDFYNQQTVQENDLNCLDATEKMQAEKYIRVAFRGKLGNSTALLVDKIKILPGLNLLIKLREAAGVHPSNKFLFAKPSVHDRNLTFDAYRTHKEICEKFNFNHEKLSFTKLRKHLATEISKKGATEADERRVSTYMSHDFNIHKKIYDHSAANADITRVSKHLEQTIMMKGEVESGRKRKKRISTKHRLKRPRLEQEEEEDSDYIPDDLSDFDEPSLEEVESCLGKIQKRKLWSSSEKSATRDFFEYEINHNKPIENSQIRIFKKNHASIMQNRSVPMIKQWLEGEKNKVLKQKHGFKDIRPRFSTPEKEILQKSVERLSHDNSEPSTEIFEKLIEENEVFRRFQRTPEALFRKFKEVRKSI